MRKKIWIYIGLVLVLIGAIATLMVVFSGPSKAEKYETDLFVEGKVLVQKDGKYGFLNKKGKVVIDFIYDEATKFYNGVAIVQMNDEYFLINDGGSPINDQKYDDLKMDIKSDLIIYKTNTKYGLMDLKGKKVIEAVYDRILDFSEGMTEVQLNGKWGFINETGKLVVECKYDDVEAFSDGYAVVKMNNLYGYINKKGEQKIPVSYAYAASFIDGYAIVVVKSNNQNKFQVINKTGKIMINDYDQILRTKNGYVGRIEDSFFILNKKGDKIALSSQYNDVTTDPIVDFFSAYDKNNKEYHLINGKGEVIFTLQYGNQTFDYGADMYELTFWKAYYTDNTLTLVSMNGKELTYQVNDLGNNIVVGFNKIILAKSSKYGVIDFKGRTLIDFNFDEISLTRDGYAVVKRDQKVGVVNMKGDIIIPIEYDYIPVWDFYE